MNSSDHFDEVMYEEQMRLADRELSSFIAAVTALYDRQQAELAAEDWLRESELMDMPPRSEERDWRAVTIAAAARLASRVNSRGGSAAQNERQCGAESLSPLVMMDQMPQPQAASPFAISSN